MSIGPLTPGNSDAGSPGGEDARNLANQHASGTATDQSNLALKEVEGLSLGRIVFRRFLRHRAAMISLGVMAVVIILSFSSIGVHIGPINFGGWWKYTVEAVPAPVDGGRPTLSIFPFNWGEHPFGQDSVGHDIFANVMRGIQQSLMIIVVSGAVSTFIGTTLGAIAGYFGGWVDSVIMRTTDLVIIVPYLLVAAIVGHALAGAGSWVLAIFLGLLFWTTLARLVRGEVLALREREFVEAAKVAGSTNFRIIFRHILPNAVGVIVVSTTLTMSATILTETAISFLGFGVQSPDTSLGKLIGDYQTAFATRPYLFWWPAVFIIIIALSINFVGDGLRDAFDPRQRRGLGRAARKERGVAESTALQKAEAEERIEGSPDPVEAPR
ncbi:MAG: ABC transporter permease [Gordonia polyisoprenivorans]|nr:ABC transporter permease [Gordonia polyisoprenivorans]